MKGNIMKSQPSLRITTLVTVLSAGLLVACSDSSQQTAGEKLDQSVAMAQQKGEEVKSSVEQGAAELKDQASAMATDAKNTIGDATITAQVNASLAKDPALSVMAIDVETTQNNVTLRGSVPDAAASSRATQLAQAVEGVTSVDNQLVVK